MINWAPPGLKIVGFFPGIAVEKQWLIGYITWGNFNLEKGR
jgi:hypothetical protein